ncbi:MAG: GNAT family N-acetyltransferase [Cetobacterium sp.]
MEGNIKITNPNTNTSLDLEIRLYNSKLTNERNKFKSSNSSHSQLDYFIKYSSSLYHENKFRGIFEIFYNNEYIGFFSFHFQNISFNRRGYENEIQTFVNIDYFAINKNYQRQKIGTAVFTYIINNISQLSKKYNCISGIVLTPLNQDIAKFYEYFGFKERDSAEEYILIF